MRVWLITVGEPLPLAAAAPRLLRTGLLAAELERRGHDVTWWTSSVDHSAKRYFPGSPAPQPIGPRQEIRFLRGRLYQRNISWQRLVNHRQIAADFTRQSAAMPAPDVILCSLPTIELSRGATRYGQQRSVPVYLDIRDLWPDVLERAFPGPLSALGRILVTPLRHQAHAALRQAAGLIGISRRYLDWGLRGAGRTMQARDTVIPLGYPRPAAGGGALPPGVDAARPLVLFVGSFGRSYDLAPMIGAARLLAGTPAQFVICGDGERAAEWRAAARGMTNVVFTGWRDSRDVGALLRHSAIGVAAYAEGALQGLPNKLFEYFSAGLPVASSLSGEAAELLAREECGLSYRPGSAESLAEVLTALLDPSLRSRLGRNAKALYDREFDGELVTQRLADHITRA